MAMLIHQNVVGQQVDAPRTLDLRAPRRRRLSSIVGRHADRSRPFVVSISRAGQMLLPADDTVVLRGAWRRTLVPRDATVVVTYIPLGGGGSSGGGNTGKAIGGALAMIALAVVAPYAVGALGGVFGSIGALTTVGKIAAAGIVMGGGYLISKATQAKSNKADSSSEPLYGVSGGGNRPQPGSRIPVGYGRFWAQPDLSQPDYIINDGEDQLLYKRMTLGLGEYDVEEIRVGDAVLWTAADGVHSTFAGAEVEIIAPGGTSSLVPGSVISSDNVAGAEVARTSGNPSLSGPYPVTPVGTTTKRIQLDWSLPYGCYMNWNKNGAQLPVGYEVKFEYAPIDGGDNPTAAWSELHYAGQNMNTTRAQRYTVFKDVAEGRYAVRAYNTQPQYYYDQYGENRLYNDVTWDGLRSVNQETITRPHVTEIAVKIRSGKTLAATTFSDLWVRATRRLPVWNGSSWATQPTRKAVWAWCDIMRSAYGGNLLDSQVDVTRALHYATTLTDLDTFDGIIRGPVSVHEAASTVLGVIRADPVRIGNTWSIGRDEPRAVARHVFTRRQIVRDSSQAHFQVSRDDGQADVIVEYYADADSRRRRETRATFGAASLTPRRYAATGVSTYEHAHHLATWMAAAAYYRRERRTITVEHEGRLVSRGDPARMDVWYMSDAVAAGIVAQNGYTLTLDTDVDAAGKYAIIRSRRNREWGPVSVSQAGNAHTVVLHSADVAAAESNSGLSLGNVCDDNGGDMPSVLIGPLTELQDAYIIDSATPQGRDRVTIEAVRDSDAVWTAIGQAVPPEPEIPSRGDMDNPSVPVIPWLRAVPVQKTNALDMEWSVGTARGAARYVTSLTYDGGATWERVSDGPSTSGTYALRYVEGVAVKVAAYAVTEAGVIGPEVYATFDTFMPSVGVGENSVDFEALSEQLRYEISLISKRGEDLQQWVSDYFAGIKFPEFDWSNIENGSLEDLNRKIEGLFERLAAAEATTTAQQQVNVDRIKVELTKGDVRNWSAIERVDEARISDKEAIAQTTEALAVQLEDARAAILEEKTARATETEALAAATTSLQARIEDPDSGLSASASAIDALQTRVTKTEDGVSSVSSRTTTLESKVDDPRTGLNAIALAYDNLETRVDTTESGVSAVSSRTSALESRIDKVFVSEKGWGFSEGLEGWSGYNANTWWDSGAANLTKTNTVAGLQISGLSVATGRIPKLKIRYRRATGAGTGVSRLRWRTSTFGDQWTNGIELPAAPTTEWIEHTADLSGTGRWTGTLEYLLFVASDGVGASGQFVIDYMALGSDGAAASAGAVSQMETRVEAAEGTITSVSTAVTSLSNRVTIAEGGLSGTSEAMNALSSRVTAAEGTITSTSQSLTALKNSVENPSTGLSATATALDAVETRVDATETGISAVGTRISALETGSGSVFVAERAWDFGNNMTGWSNSASGGGVWVDAALGVMNITKQTTTHNVWYPGLSISTSLIPALKIRYRRVSGTNSGAFVVRFATTGSTSEWSASNRIELPAPTDNGVWIERTVDIASVASGWHGNCTLIMMLPSDGTGTGSQFQVDYIALGRPGAAVSAGAYEKVEATIAATGAQVTAQATALSTLQSTVGDQTSRITNLQETVAGPNGLTAQYGVTIDLGNQVQGGFLITGAKKLDGTGSVNIRFQGDVFVDGTFTASKLVTNQVIIQNSTQMGGNTIVTNNIANNAVSNMMGFTQQKYMNETSDVVEFNVRPGAKVLVIGKFFATELNQAHSNLIRLLEAPGNLCVSMNNNIVSEFNAQMSISLPTEKYTFATITGLVFAIISPNTTSGDMWRWFKLHCTDYAGPSNLPLGRYSIAVAELAR